MMIRKIISGGQTGADQAALDTAIKLGIPHGGWIPKGRMTEDGPLAENYHLDEMDTTSYHERTEQNVIDSDGTLIFSHGPLTGGSLYTRKMAEKHDRPCLHVDLNRIRPFEATITTSRWIIKNEIGVLNVAGPRASKDPSICELVGVILEGAINRSQVKLDKPPADSPDKPKTVAEAVTRLVMELPLEDRTRIANMSIGELELLDDTIGSYIRDKFEGNKDLIASCEFKTKEKAIDPGKASAIIVEALWRQLRATHKLRVVR